MNIFYDAIRLYHGISGVYSDTETHKKLYEIRYCEYTNDKRCMALKKTVDRRNDHINMHEAGLLREFPIHGIDLGNVSNAMLFASELSKLSLKTQKAYAALLRAGYLGIVVGYREGKRVEILTRV